MRSRRSIGGFGIILEEEDGGGGGEINGLWLKTCRESSPDSGKAARIPKVSRLNALGLWWRSERGGVEEVVEGGWLTLAPLKKMSSSLSSSPASVEGGEVEIVVRNRSEDGRR